MIYATVCSGVEAASLAWEPLGWRPAFFSEIAAFPRAVLGQRWPHVPLHGDFTTIKAGDYGSIDLLAGGTPCQSFSVAGKRAGLDDPRGHLTLEFLGLARRLRPRWLVWENVPGFLSDDGGRTAAAFFRALGQCGYGFAYAVLDAQYFGVPQRRRRVVVVGYLGDWRPPAAVLLEPQSLRGDPAPRREAGEGFAPDLAASLTASGRGVERPGESRRQDPVVAMVAGTLQASGKAAGSATQQDSEAGLLVPVRLNGDWRCAACGEGNAAAWAPTCEWCGHEAARAPLAFGGNNTRGPIDVATACNAHGGPHGRGPIDVATACNAHGGPHGRGDFESETFIAFDTTQITSAGNYSNPHPGDACHPLAASAHPPAIAFDCKASGRNGFGVGTVSPTLRAMGHADSHQNAGGQVAIAIQEVGKRTGVSTDDRRAGIGIAQPGDPMFTLQAGAQHGVATQWAVRRLTPMECERLQGMPDDHTRIAWRGKPPELCPDGPRYKAIGNSWAVPKFRWLGERIDFVDRALISGAWA